MAVALRDLPKYLVLDPSSTVRLDMRLHEPSCELDVSLDNPRPGRSFVLMIGHEGGPLVQRVRLSGRARIVFDPGARGDYVLALTNPDVAPVVLRLRARAVGGSSGTKTPMRPMRLALNAAARGPSRRVRRAERTRRGPPRSRARPRRGRRPRRARRRVAARRAR